MKFRSCCRKKTHFRPDPSLSSSTRVLQTGQTRMSRAYFGSSIRFYLQDSCIRWRKLALYQTPLRRSNCGGDREERRGRRTGAAKEHCPRTERRISPDSYHPNFCASKKTGTKTAPRTSSFGTVSAVSWRRLQVRVPSHGGGHRYCDRI